MDSVPKDLDQGLLQELECPVCMETMKPPITMCENGHSICANCKPKLTYCPSCTKPFLHVRNLALESLSRQVTDQMGEQQPTRFPQSVECPFTRISKGTCPWRGPLVGMKDHVKVYHNNLNDMHESNGAFNVVLTGLSPGQHYRKIVFISDELYYIYWRIKDDCFYCAVLHVGEDKICSKYKYKFTLTTESDDKKISMSFPTRCILEDLEEILLSGDCVILKYNTVLKFLNANMHLECEFEINVIESDMNIAGKAGERSVCVEPDVRSPLFGRCGRHRNIRRHEKGTSVSTDRIVSVGKPGRCAHGRRFRHCRICKYFTTVPNTEGSSAELSTDSLHSIQLPTGFYCEPSGHFVENASSEKCYVDSKVTPTAPPEKDPYSDVVENSSNLSTDKEASGEKREYLDGELSAETKSHSSPNEYECSNPSSGSTWMCQLCEKTAPRFPDSLPEPGWHVSSSPTGTKWVCKMCGQIRE
ncbi:uncharacterized protein LOC110833383 [Zootermopsis nevadensis]|uniref:E3 ubiquitin-protein ligase n=1 Tax=Zootermopsis nevadensis TaxID=136037 RepID=A0A067R140_ZOONE|nr:uncharacterized protein LOC110833383 [Zootermopsis nevadensis]KDR15644.1 E3 ubiquitin-protein ligase Siah1 [Zootermopsis nevadensis]